MFFNWVHLILIIVIIGLKIYINTSKHCFVNIIIITINSKECNKVYKIYIKWGKTFKNKKSSKKFLTIWNMIKFDFLNKLVNDFLKVYQKKRTYLRADLCTL